MSAIQRFFGFGAGNGSALTLGDGHGLQGLGAIDGEFLDRLREANDEQFHNASPERALELENEAARLQSSADVYGQILRAKQKKAGAFVKAATAKLNHGVAIATLNSQLVGAQGRAIQQHSRIGFKNSMVMSTTEGTVTGYTSEHKTFQF
jgi:hypothetical protein